MFMSTATFPFCIRKRGGCRGNVGLNALWGRGIFNWFESWSRSEGKKGITLDNCSQMPNQSLSLADTVQTDSLGH
ncbi:hypothetical protein E2C01_013070 [Portunus trituberculatus]|uniref:Uncharacterized protein n=1 Tax=Portunus trituberculatus TaxID=210409 RepID=A0A5B7DFP3_PORTR|nr:hypothetical protein [Portunus trituberculatus]